MTNKSDYELLAYTRKPDANRYPAGLANSIHFAWRMGNTGTFIPFFRNYGMLFTQGEILSNDTICPKGLIKPLIFKTEEGSCVIAAEKVMEDGSKAPEDENLYACFTTGDFITFTDLGMLSEKEMNRQFKQTPSSLQKTIANPSENKDFPEGAEQGCKLTVSSEIIERMRQHWDQITIRDKAKKLAIETAKKYPFPLTRGYGDPVIFFWEGHYYYIATNDNKDDIGIYVREADTPQALFAEGIKEHLILDYDPERELIQTFWAPEFHVIGEELYILFAVGPKQWGPQCHVMKLKKGQSIINPDSWEDPIRIKRADGSFLSEDGITLDMTYLDTPKEGYVIWSYRKYIGTSLDTGSMLYIATIDKKQPWKLTSEPVLLTRPLLSWENVAGTINNEGPNVLICGDQIYMTYSGGAADSYTYALGLLRAKTGDDLLKLSSWKKSNTPILTYKTIPGEYGPGHNSFFVDTDGTQMIAFHAEESRSSHIRCASIHPILFDEEGNIVVI